MEGRKNQVASGQGNVHRHLHALGSDRLLGDLNHDLLALLQGRVDRGPPLAQDVGDVEVGVLLEADAHERRGDARQDVLDDTLVDVADDRLLALALPKELRKPPVLDDRDPGFLEARARQELALDGHGGLGEGSARGLMAPLTMAALGLAPLPVSGPLSVLAPLGLLVLRARLALGGLGRATAAAAASATASAPVPILDRARVPLARLGLRGNFACRDERRVLLVAHARGIVYRRRMGRRIRRGIFRLPDLVRLLGRSGSPRRGHRLGLGFRPNLRLGLSRRQPRLRRGDRRRLCRPAIGSSRRRRGRPNLPLGSFRRQSCRRQGRPNLPLGPFRRQPRLRRGGILQIIFFVGHFILHVLSQKRVPPQIDIGDDAQRPHRNDQA